MPDRLNKTRLAKKLGIARSTLYYQSKKRSGDEAAKRLTEDVVLSNPSYGHKRVALALKMNRKKISRLMRKYGLKPRIRRFKRLTKPGDLSKPAALYDNIVYKLCPLQADIA